MPKQKEGAAGDAGMTEQRALTEAEIDAILARAGAATPGLWETFESGSGYDAVIVHMRKRKVGFVAEQLYAKDATFIAHARADVPRLAADLRQALADRTARDAAIRAEERAFVLDHMPRAAMARAIREKDAELPTGMPNEQCSDELVDAALSAARAALLPGDDPAPVSER